MPERIPERTSELVQLPVFLAWLAAEQGQAQAQARAWGAWPLRELGLVRQRVGGPAQVRRLA